MRWLPVRCVPGGILLAAASSEVAYFTPACLPVTHLQLHSSFCCFASARPLQRREDSQSSQSGHGLGSGGWYQSLLPLFLPATCPSPPSVLNLTWCFTGNDQWEARGRPRHLEGSTVTWACAETEDVAHSCSSAFTVSRG